MVRMMTWAFLAAALLATPLVAPASEAVYQVPANLTCSLTPPSVVDLDSVHGAVAEIHGKLGTLRDMQVFFTSSADLAISPATGTIAQLDAGKSARFNLTVTPVPQGFAGAAGSFIKMRIVYRPDYEALSKAVADATKYPVTVARQQLQEIVDRNETAQAEQTDVTDHRYQAPRKHGLKDAK